MRTLTLSAICSLFAATLAGPALAAKTTTVPGRVAKDAFAAQRGRSIERSHEVYSFGGSREFVTAWDGPAKGPGARGAYVMVVPLRKQRADMLVGVKISKDLEQAGKALVREHLTQNGLTGRIELGDHMLTSPKKYGGGNRLKQAPFTRDSGFLRYTVTAADGGQKRYLVATHPKALVRGGRILGRVTLDTDGYGQKPLK